MAGHRRVEDREWNGRIWVYSRRCVCGWISAQFPDSGPADAALAQHLRTGQDTP